MSSLNFKLGQPVWAKMKGYPLWPGKIMSVHRNSQRKNQEKYQVFFFGTHDHAWINLSNLTPHSENVISTLSKRRTPTHQAAIDELIKYYLEQEEKNKNDESMDIEEEESDENNQNSEQEESDTNNQHTERESDENIELQNGHIADSVSVENEVDSESSVSFDIDSESENVVECERSPYMIDLSSSSSEDESQPSTSGYKQSVTNKRSPSTSPRSHEAILKNKKILQLPVHTLAQNSVTHEPENNLQESKASHLKLGFIGMGNIGKCLIKKLLNHGTSVSIWYDEISDLLRDEFERDGATIAKHPEDLILNCDITFCNVKDSKSVKEVLFSNHGVLSGLDKLREKSGDSGGTFYRGYVEMSPIDWETSLANSEALAVKGGHYLEACTISEESETENFIFLIAGEYTLYETIKQFLNEIASQVFFISIGSGNACRMRTLFNALSGTICAALAEASVLVDRLKLPKYEFVNVVRNGPVGCEPVVKFAQKMIVENFKKDTSVSSVERDLSNAVAMSQKFVQSIPVTVTACDQYIRVKKLQSSADMSAIYKTVKYS